MKILLVAINAKYIHSNLAVYYLKACAPKEQQEHMEIAEYTINNSKEEIRKDIYKRQPDVIAVSCYIWNITMVRELVPELSKVLPKAQIWLGGPEVAYDATNVIESLPQIKGVVTGELLIGDGSEFRILTEPQPLLNMDDIPFIYQDLNLKEFENRIIYYESSRGCPFSCSYCLSSIEKQVRFRSISLVEKELQFFLDHRVPQVKFVDRTFNCSHQHAMAIWNYIKRNDNGVTNFHFEIAADILNEEELELLNTLRPGLVQLEIGVQSTNPETIKEIRRTMDFDKLSQIVKRIKKGNNIHEHLDLIAGLPFEDYHSFIRSFDQVMSLKPEQLQLGFLKVLKGSFMYEQKEEYGLVYTSLPPYEVLFTKWLSFDDVLKLKEIEEMVETYYNSNQFRNSLNLLENYFDSYFTMYKSLADFYAKSGYTIASPSRIKRYYILFEFVQEAAKTNRKMQSDHLVLMKMKEQLTIDLYLRENLKSRPDFCTDLTPFKQQIREFYSEESQNRFYLKNYEEFNEKQLMRMTHMDVIDQNLVLFDYQNRDPLTSDAKIWNVKSMEVNNDKANKGNS
ncbi:MAG: DUF4080 domain-containing protein [Lachnospiraceae bacterium]|nr:DUF4080 domain-containing protein [Lachnospiraceae bacterium]